MRLLKAREIECRAQQVKQNGLVLLLYKDARCDMAILDEEFGPDRWQRKHELIDGRLYCSVGVKYGDEWVWKQDVGTESNTEKEKGQASDSFKRACFNVGIGRELYTAPFIWISSDKCEISSNNGRFFCNTRFEVADVAYNEFREITKLTIVNSKNGSTVYTYGVQDKPKPAPRAKQQPKEEPKAEAVHEWSCKRCGKAITPMTFKGTDYSDADLAQMSMEKYGQIYCCACGKEIKKENGK